MVRGGKMLTQRTWPEKLFSVFNHLILSIALLITLYPFYYVIIASISNGSEIIKGNVVLTPIGFNLDAYIQIPSINYFWTAYANTFFYTIFGALFSLIAMSLGAYALSRKQLRCRRGLGFMVSFTMWFSVGMIPIYVNMDSLNLLDSRIGIIFGFLCNAFYIIIMRTYFEGLPVELEESAKLDGCSNFGIYLKIFMPLSKPMIATIALYCLVDRWNSYLWSTILLKTPTKIPLQVLLKKLIIENKVLAEVSSGGAGEYTVETLVYAVVVVSIIPILALYPFIQRYFVKGLTLGAVKG